MQLAKNTSPSAMRMECQSRAKDPNEGGRVDYASSYAIPVPLRRTIKGFSTGIKSFPLPNYSLHLVPSYNHMPQSSSNNNASHRMNMGSGRGDNTHQQLQEMKHKNWPVEVLSNVCFIRTGFQRYLQSVYYKGSASQAKLPVLCHSPRTSLHNNGAAPGAPNQKLIYRVTSTAKTQKTGWVIQNVSQTLENIQTNFLQNFLFGLNRRARRLDAGGNLSQVC